MSDAKPGYKPIKISKDANFKAAIVMSRYNENITYNLMAGAVQGFLDYGIPKEQLSSFEVPGVFDLPLIVKKVACSNEFSCIVVLGAVIKGETSHDVHISTATFNQLSLLSVEYDLPITLGILTTNSMEQANARSGGSLGNRGYDAAESAIQLIKLISEIPCLKK